jgi:hypothetical protein
MFLTLASGKHTMKVYQIDYDLRKQKNYEALHERIRSYGKHIAIP